VSFNLLNKSIFKYFPFPYTVSTVHVLVGSVYCIIVYLLGLKSWSFGRVRSDPKDAARQSVLIAAIMLPSCRLGLPPDGGVRDHNGQQQHRREIASDVPM
jgi:hypothetical protein